MMRHLRHWPMHLALALISALMLVPFYWVLKTSLTGENIFAYPPSLLPHDPNPFYFVDVWYAIPFLRYLINSVVVSRHRRRRQRVSQRHGRLCADARLPGQGRDHHAVPVAA